MSQKFEFNKYNTDLDKKLRRIRGDSTGQKIARIAVPVVLILIVVIIIFNIISSEARKAEENLSNFDTEQFKSDVKSSIGNTANDIKDSVSSGIQGFFSK